MGSLQVARLSIASRIDEYAMVWYAAVESVDGEQ
jgi:hypothetical protein